MTPYLHRIVLGAALVLIGCQPTTLATAPSGPPQRIVSQLILADELLWEAGEDVRSRVIAVSKLADDPEFSGVAGRWPKTLPRVGGSGEALVALRPDLVIVASYTSQDLRALLRGAGIKTLVIDRFNSFDDFRHNARALAASLGDPPLGEKFVKDFDRRLQQARATEPSNQTITTWSEGLVAAGKTTFHDAVVAAGLENIAAREGLVSHQRISLERLVLWNPQLLVVSCRPGTCAARSEELRNRVGIKDTAAAKKGGIIPIPQRVLSSTGFGMIELVQMLKDGAAAKQPTPPALPNGPGQP